MSTNFDFDALDEAIKNAPVAGFGPRAVFGKCTLEINIVSWKDKRPSFRVPKKGETADTSKGEYFQFTFHINVTELNTSLTKEWKRTVDLKRSNKADKDQSKWTLTDYTETVEPSLVKVFGPTWYKTLAKGAYVEVSEVTTVETDKNGNLRGWDAKEPNEDGSFTHYTNTVPSFVRSFKSLADCLAAYTERYKKSDDSFGGIDTGIPAKIISDVKGVLKAVDDNETVIQIVSNTYGSYDLVALLTAAEASEELLELAAAE